MEFSTLAVRPLCSTIIGGGKHSSLQTLERDPAIRSTASGSLRLNRRSSWNFQRGSGKLGGRIVPDRSENSGHLLHRQPSSRPTCCRTGYHTPQKGRPPPRRNLS